MSSLRKKFKPFVESMRFRVHQPWKPKFPDIPPMLLVTVHLGDGELSLCVAANSRTSKCLRELADDVDAAMAELDALCAPCAAAPSPQPIQEA